MWSGSNEQPNSRRLSILWMWRPRKKGSTAIPSQVMQGAMKNCWKFSLLGEILLYLLTLRRYWELLSSTQFFYGCDLIRFVQKTSSKSLNGPYITFFSRLASQRSVWLAGVGFQRQSIVVVAQILLKPVTSIITTVLGARVTAINLSRSQNNHFIKWALPTWPSGQRNQPRFMQDASLRLSI